MIFKDRFDAGTQLAQHLLQYKHNPDTIIAAIPRGGVEIGAALSKILRLPLDIVLAKKIGYPGNPEYAIGAVSLEQVIIDDAVAHASSELTAYISREIEKIRALLKKRYQHYKGDKPLHDVTNKLVILTDDGVATGGTVIAALHLLKKSGAKKIIVATPVIPQNAYNALTQHADEIIALTIPEFFFGISQFYQNFRQVPDEEAVRLLQEAETTYASQQD